MRRAHRAFLLAAALLVLGASPAGATDTPPKGAIDPLPEIAAPPHVGHRVYDAVVLRPLRIVQVVVGVVALVPAYPMALLIGADDAIVEACVHDPVDRAFRAPLGTL